MSKAAQYGLSFTIFDSGYDNKIPLIKSKKNAQGHNINMGIVGFLDRLRVSEIDMFLQEIQSLDPFNKTINLYDIDPGDDRDCIHISAQPAVATFDGGDEVVPLQDFIDIATEWRDFLNAIPYKHWRSE